MKQTYFQHDSNARNDIKLIKLRRKLGLEGYGLYFCILEMLFEDNNNMCQEYEDIAFSLNCSVEKVKQVIEDFDLFIIDDKCFYSVRLRNFLNEVVNKSKKARQSANKRWNKEECERNTSILNNNILDNIKVNNIKDRYTEFCSLVNELTEISKEDRTNFIEYWSEPNKSKSKMRFELQPTWSLKRRLKRWSNSNFNKEKSNGPNYPDYFDVHFEKRIAQDKDATRGYYEHLKKLGYIRKIGHYNGVAKWEKVNV